MRQLVLPHSHMELSQRCCKWYQLTSSFSKLAFKWFSSPRPGKWTQRFSGEGDRGQKVGNTNRFYFYTRKIISEVIQIYKSIVTNLMNTGTLMQCKLHYFHVRKGFDTHLEWTTARFKNWQIIAQVVLDTTKAHFKNSLDWGVAQLVQCLPIIPGGKGRGVRNSRSCVGYRMTLRAIWAILKSKTNMGQGREGK